MKIAKYMQLVLAITFVIFMTKAAKAGDGSSEDINYILERNGVAPKTAILLSQTMNKAGFSNAQQLEVAGMLAEQNSDSVLAVSFQRKIDEGVSKKVGPGLIVQALNRVKNRYKTADRFALGLQKENRRNLREMAIDCFAAGLTDEDASKIKASLRERARSLNEDARSQDLAIETMMTAREMLRLGVRSQQTGSLLEHALKTGEDAKAIQTLRNRFRNTLGEEANELANQFQHAFKNGMTITQANRHQLQNPGQTYKSGLGNAKGLGADRGGSGGSDSDGNSADGGSGGGNGGGSGGKR